MILKLKMNPVGLFLGLFLKIRPGRFRASSGHVMTTPIRAVDERVLPFAPILADGRWDTVENC